MQISFSVNNFSLFLCLQLLISVLFLLFQTSAHVRVSVRVWREGRGGLLYQICHVICSIFTLTSLSASFFHPPFPPSQITH